MVWIYHNENLSAYKCLIERMLVSKLSIPDVSYPCIQLSLWGEIRSNRSLITLVTNINNLSTHVFISRLKWCAVVPRREAIRWSLVDRCHLELDKNPTVNWVDTHIRGKVFIAIHINIAAIACLSDWIKCTRCGSDDLYPTDNDPLSIASSFMLSLTRAPYLSQGIERINHIGGQTG